MSGARMNYSADDETEELLATPAGRSRIITFRVSGDEADSLSRAWRASGARSLSAFARDAALDRVQSMHAPPTTLSGDLTTLTKTLTQLDQSLQEASGKIRRVLGPGGPAGEDMDSTRK